ncbi:MAG: glycosyltransferase family 4 protein, partial [Nitrospira sp.]|nr:glycosyltransferase family 4 protein [Nitrospira sp.]
MINLLHITAHLGGGVGKVLARLAAESRRRQDGIRHTVVCLEAIEKTQFVEQFQSQGGQIVICPSPQELDRQIRLADIVQLEWWHHPVVAGWMCSGELPPMRLIVWSHVSGLHAPAIPPAFAATPHRFLFSSPCSLEHRALAGLKRRVGERLGVVVSSGGFADMPAPADRSPGGPLRVGYLGTLNFAKLHPRILDFVAAVRLPDFRLALVGDPTTGARLLEAAASSGCEQRLDVRGYTTDSAQELASFDVLAYLLNPLHYGTAENALLEAMAMGVVPIVLNNPAERYVVQHMETGIVVQGPEEFADALDWLASHHVERARLSANAAATVRAAFAIERTADSLQAQYQAVLAEDKRAFDFRPIFGQEPADWFRSCQGDEVWRFCNDGDSRPV